MNDLEQRLAVSEIRSAKERREAAIAALTRPDGTPLYTDHHDRLAVVEAEFDNVADPLLSQIGEEVQAAQQALDLAQARGPLQTLSSADLARARDLREFINEDGEHLPLTDLADRLRGALADDDRAMRFVLLRAVQRRIDAERDRFASRRARGEVGPGQLHPDAALLTGLEKMIDEGGATFRDQAAIDKASARLINAEGTRARLRLEGGLIERETARQFAVTADQYRSLA